MKKWHCFCSMRRKKELRGKIRMGRKRGRKGIEIRIKRKIQEFKAKFYRNNKNKFKLSKRKYKSTLNKLRNNLNRLTKLKFK